VFGIFVFEMLQTFLVTHDMFATFASGWGDLSQLQSAHWAWLNTPIMSGIVSCVVQLFYAYRVYILSRSKILLCFIAALSITQATSAIVGGVQLAIVDNFTKLQSATRVTSIIWLSGSALCDITVASCMSYYLSRKNTAFKETQMLIKKLVRLTIETGALTATVATVDVIIFLALPSSNYHTTPAYTIAKLYSNSLVMMLNARSGARSDHISGSDALELQTARRQVLVSDTEGGLGPIRVTKTSHQVTDRSDKESMSALSFTDAQTKSRLT
jgi:hypothetical protein